MLLLENIIYLAYYLYDELTLLQKVVGFIVVIVVVSILLRFIQDVLWGRRLKPRIATNTPPEIAIDTMKAFLGDKGILQQGLIVLDRLAPHSPSHVVSEKSVRFKVVPLLLDMLETHPSDQYIVALSLRILCRMASADAVVSYFKDQGVAALGPVVAALEAHVKAGASKAQETSTNSFTILRCVPHVVGAVCDGSAELKTSAVDEGFMRAALAALDKYRNSEATVHWLSWSLFNITYGHEPNKADFVRSGGLQTIARAMKCHRGSQAVQRQAIGLLYSALVNDRGIVEETRQELARKHDLKPRIKDAKKTHVSDTQIQAMCDRILSVIK